MTSFVLKIVQNKIPVWAQQNVVQQRDKRHIDISDDQNWIQSPTERKTLE